MTKSEALVTNYNKKDLADKVVELTDKLEEMQQLEKKVDSEEAGVIAKGRPAISMIKDQNGKFHLVKITFDLETKAAVISAIEDLGTTDQQIAAGKLVKASGEIFTGLVSAYK